MADWFGDLSTALHVKYCVWQYCYYYPIHRDLHIRIAYKEKCPGQPTDSPAMDHNGFVSSPPLYHQHMLNDCHDGRRRGAETLRSPAEHLELSHLVLLARL